MVLHESFLVYARYRWFKVSAGVSAVAILAYALVDQQPRPNGGTALGYALGTAGALLIGWLMLIGVRKRWITRGRWSLKAWVSAHVYLGLALVVIATLHTGFQIGWNVHSLTYVLMLLVVASGLWGIAVYVRLPRLMSQNRGEVTQKQMLATLRQLDQQIEAAAQPLPLAPTALVRLSLEQCSIGGSLRQRLGGAFDNCGNARALAGLQALQPGDTADTLASVIALLDRKAAVLAQARRNIVLKSQLEIWLYAHVPLSFALLAALTAHVVSVFYFW
jgi:hypothetical protein